MEEEFKRNQLKPGDEGFVYDKQVCGCGCVGVCVIIRVIVGWCV